MDFEEWAGNPPLGNNFCPQCEKGSKGAITSFHSPLASFIIMGEERRYIPQKIARRKKKKAGKGKERSDGGNKGRAYASDSLSLSLSLSQSPSLKREGGTERMLSEVPLEGEKEKLFSLLRKRDVDFLKISYCFLWRRYSAIFGRVSIAL